MTHYRSAASQHARRLPATFRASVVAFCLTAIAHPALASGTLPPEPLTAGPFQTFADCLNYLETTHREQATLAMPKPLPTEKGGTHQTLVTTKGVLRGPGEQATYEAEIGFEFRATDTERQAIVTNYTWERYSLTCNGPTFSGSLERGYALPGFEPIRP